MSALVATPARVLWSDFGAYDRDAYKRRERRARRAAAAVSLSIDFRKAAVWYRITRARACEHPDQGVQRYREGDLVFCTCGACASRWKEAA
jgi:hypothetical protein